MENATLKQTLNGACPTAQLLASNVRELTGTQQSHPFIERRPLGSINPQQVNTRAELFRNCICCQRL